MLSGRRSFYFKTIRTANIVTLFFALLVAAAYGQLFELLLKHVSNVTVFTLIILTSFAVLQTVLYYLFERLHQETTFVTPTIRYEFIHIFLSIILVILLVFFATYSIKKYVPITINAYVIFFVIALVSNGISMLAIRYLSTRYNNSHDKTRNIVIVGSNQRAVEFKENVLRDKILGINVIGFIDEKDFSSNDVNILGNLDSLPEIIRTNILHAVVIYLPIRSFYDKIQDVINAAKEQGVQVYYLTNLFEYAKGSVRLADFYGIPSILLSTSPREDWRYFVKSVIDVSIASLVLFFTFPIIFIAIVLMKISSPGPAFFIQERVGHYKNTFKLIKLRTMVPNAEDIHKDLESANEMDGPVFKIKDDPRVNNVGKILRRYGIDELPQLINVILGDMSIVGPRPLALRDYRGFSEDWLRRRFSVKPGLTCYWQCMPFRNKLSFSEWMQLDMQYIDNWSLLEDFKIMVKTVPAVFRGTGV